MAFWLWTRPCNSYKDVRHKNKRHKHIIIHSLSVCIKENNLPSTASSDRANESSVMSLFFCFCFVFFICSAKSSEWQWKLYQSGCLTDSCVCVYMCVFLLKHQLKLFPIQMGHFTLTRKMKRDNETERVCTCKCAALALCVHMCAWIFVMCVCVCVCLLNKLYHEAGDLVPKWLPS